MDETQRMHGKVKVAPISLAPPVELEEDPFICLGVDAENYYLYIKDIKLIKSFKQFTPRTLTQNIHPNKSWWESRFAPRSEWAEKATEFIIQSCNRAGLWDSSRKRNIGLWRDGKVITAHLGDRLLINGEETFNMIQDDYIYERGRIVRCDSASPLSQAEAEKFVDIVKMFPWTNRRYVPIYAGWCVLAFIGGALQWRPHIWVTGKIESGKSRLVDHVTIPILSGMVLNVGGATTMPGIEQCLKGRSCPVVFDEIEGDNKTTNSRIEKILEMVRGASTETGAIVAKGTTHGEARITEIRSMFYFSSVAHSLQGAANTSRTEVVELDNALFSHSFDDVISACSLITPEYAARFVGHSMAKIAVIQENIKVFNRAFRATVAGSSRDFDMLSAFMAAYASLIIDGVISEAEAVAQVKEYDWAFQRVKVNDAEDLWRTILEMDVLVEYDQLQVRNFHASIGKLLDYAEGFKLTGIRQDGTIDALTQDKAEEALAKYGIKYKDSDPAYIYVSNTSTRLKERLSNTKWNGNHSGTLSRISGALGSGAERFSIGEPPSKATRIPRNYLREGELS